MRPETGTHYDDRFKCRTCGRYVSGRVPSGGDGTAVRLFRHGPRPGCPDRGLYIVARETDRETTDR